MKPSPCRRNRHYEDGIIEQLDTCHNRTQPSPAAIQIGNLLVACLRNGFSHVKRHGNMTHADMSDIRVLKCHYRNHCRTRASEAKNRRCYG